jgi:ferredoxin
MRVTVDREACVGSGNCALSAPAVFAQDEDDGRVMTVTDTPGPALRAMARAASARCPVGAITLHEHDGAD